MLAVLAGLVQPDAGQCVLDGEVLFGPDVRVPPHRRRIGLLTQDSLLFPRMSVIDNVAFGPRSSGCSRGEALAMAQRWLTEVDASDLAGRKPSGVVRRAAAAGRTRPRVATDPRLLLLDEPLPPRMWRSPALMRQTPCAESSPTARRSSSPIRCWTPFCSVIGWPCWSPGGGRAGRHRGGPPASPQ